VTHIDFLINSFHVQRVSLRRTKGELMLHPVSSAAALLKSKKFAAFVIFLWIHFKTNLILSVF